MSKCLAAFSLLSVVVLQSCTTPGQQPSSSRLFAEATPLCTIMENASSYVGKRLLVRGYLTQTPHGRVFWDDGCKRGILPLGLSPESPSARHVEKLLAQSNRRPPRVYVVFSGTFIGHSPMLVCRGLCIEFTLESAELVAVRPG